MLTARQVLQLIGWQDLLIVEIAESNLSVEPVSKIKRLIIDRQ
ncbi:MAG: hypothetical protein QNJ54_15300 [Prochloraceae cyanobacterium]|nr:hypothetical protein [Prochloraceae cyanobacterium]